MPFRLKLDERLLGRLKHTDEKHTLIKTSLYDVVKTALEKDGDLTKVHDSTIANGGEYPYSTKSYGEANVVCRSVPFITKICDIKNNLYLLTDNLQEIKTLIDHLDTRKRKYSSEVMNKNWD